ncbi:MAG: ComEC/Rec2 family competence protein [Saccharofermentanales bacterium]
MKIYQLTNHTRSQMMGYILVTKENQVVVIDGGCAEDSADIRRILAQQNNHVDIWLLTHPHYDHHSALMEIMENPAGISVEGIYYSYIPNEWGTNEPSFQIDIININACLSKTKWPVHNLAGDEQLILQNLVIDVLGIANPDITINAINNSSCVFKVTEGAFSLMVLGDLGVEAGKLLLERHEDVLKSTAVQMAHHGQSGVGRDVYQSIVPRYAFWPTPDWLWDNTLDPASPGQGPWETFTVRSWMECLHTININSFRHTVMFDSETGLIQEF